MKRIEFTAKKNNGYKTETGYKVEVNYKGEDYEIAVYQYTDEESKRPVWGLIEMTSGLRFVKGQLTRKSAIECITVELMDKLEKCLERKDTKLAIERLNDYKKKVAENVK